MATYSALNVFLAREIGSSKVFNTRHNNAALAVQTWASELAAVSSRVEEFAELVQIASSLPLPQSGKEQQQALELATLLLPSRALWASRPAPQEQSSAKREAYWKQADEFFSRLLSLPGIDPLAIVSHPAARSRVEVRKMPLALLMMHAGRHVLLEKSCSILPQDYRQEAAEACVRFHKLPLAERILGHWNPSDPLGQKKAQEQVWMMASLDHLAASEHLPSFDPPAQWWSRCLSSNNAAAAERVARERPHLSWRRANAHLQSGRTEHLLALRLLGGVADRATWVSANGVELPAFGLMSCAYAGQYRERVFEKSCAQEWAARLGLVSGMLNPEHQKEVEHQSWDILARWLFAAGAGVSLGSQWSPVLDVGQSAIEQVQSAAATYRETALTAGGHPDMTLLTPLVQAFRAAAFHDGKGDLAASLQIYQKAMLPWLRDLAAFRCAITSQSKQQAMCYSAAAEMMAVWPQTEKQTTPAVENVQFSAVALEMRLWLAAFQRLEAKGASRAFPSSMGVARPTWDAIRSQLALGVEPDWDQASAQVLHALVLHDPKLPDDIRSFVQAQSLRQTRSFAPKRPRRI